MHHNFVSDMVEKFSGTIRSIAAGFQKQLKPSGQQKPTDEGSHGTFLDAENDNEDVDELDIFNLIHQKEQAEKEQLAQVTHQDKDQARLTQLQMNLLTKCKKQFEHYIGFCESKINGNWAAIICKFSSKTYLLEHDKWDNETITKFERTVRRAITMLSASISMSWAGGIIIKMITHICTPVHYYGYQSQQLMHSRNASFP